MLIPIHSIADIITNSSTVEYIMASNRTIEVFKAFMQDVLKTAGVTTPVDELFNIEIEPDPNWVKNTIYEDLRGSEWGIDYTIDMITPELFSRIDSNYNTREEYIQYLKNGEDWEGISHLYIKITTKEGEDITHDIQDSFGLASRYDG